MTPRSEDAGVSCPELEGPVLDLDRACSQQDVVIDVDSHVAAGPSLERFAGSFLQRSSSPRAVSQAQPQVVPGKGPVWPEHWGLTHEQIRQLLHRLRCDPAWKSHNSVYTLVQDYVIPWTRGTGMGYALLLNQEEPQEVDVMVSHAWGENAEDFFEALLRSTTKEDVLFVCALCIYQAEDGVGPSIEEQVGTEPSGSPFERVIRNIKENGKRAGWRWRWRRTLKLIPLFCVLLAIILFFMPTVLWGCVATFKHCASQNTDLAFESTLLLFMIVPARQSDVVSNWQWLPMPYWWGMLFPISAIALLVCGAFCYAFKRRFRIYAGRMVAVPNYEVDIYSRLWCVYEIFIAHNFGISVQVARTLAAGGTKSSRYAVCSSEKDMLRIQQEIEATPLSYVGIDKTVYKTMHGAMWDAIRVAFIYGVMISFFRVASARITTDADEDIESAMYVIIQTSAPLASSFAVMTLLYKLFRKTQGSPSVCVLAGFSMALMLAGIAVLALGAHVQERHMMSMGPGKFKIDGLAVWFFRFGSCFVEDGFYMAMLLVCTRCAMCSAMGVRFLFLGAISMAVFVFCMVCDLGGVDGWSSEIMYPAVVAGISKVAGHVLIPLYALTASATKWGVTAGGRGADAKSCRELEAGG